MKHIIEVGACYQDSEVFWNQWRVERITADYRGTPHAVVQNLSDPTVSRTIACKILEDRRRFFRIEIGELQPQAPVLVAPVAGGAAAAVMSGIGAAA